MRCVIRGVGVVGGFGCGIDNLAAAAVRGGCPPGAASVKTGLGSIDMPVFLADTSALEGFASKKALRRVDHYSRMALLGSYLALQDAGVLDEHHEKMGIIIATGYGASSTTFSFLDSFLRGGDSLSSPTHFSNSVHNAAVANISLFLGITGPGLTVSQFEMSVTSAVITARCWLEEGIVDSVLFGGVDEYCDVLGYCWHRFYGANTAESGMIPLDFDLQSAIPGEGAAFFLLSREGRSESDYGSIDNIQFAGIDDQMNAGDTRSVLFIEADGHKKYGPYYKRYLAGSDTIACYSPLYGSFPTSQVFSMAMAALAMKGRRFLPSPGYSVGSPGQKVLTHAQVLDDERIVCVKIDARGKVGSITIARE